MSFNTKEEAVEDFIKTYLAYDSEMEILREDLKQIRTSMKEMQELGTYAEHLSNDDMKNMILAIRAAKKGEDVDQIAEFFTKAKELYSE